METFNRTLLNLLALVAVAYGSSLAMQAQTRYPAQLQIDSLEPLAAKAEKIVDVSLPDALLRLIPIEKIHSTDVDVKDLKAIVAGLRGVYVKDFEFTAPGAWTQADIEPIRAQLRAPGWTRFVNVVDKREGRNVEVYLMTAPQGARVEGLAVLALEPKQLTVVNIIGIIDIEKLSKLEGQFGIPELDLEEEKPDEKRPEKPAAVAAPAKQFKKP
jgi:hypothetical protein